ncbi:hypothetical protein MSPP1_002197 [Malassezia sp. CBS 17886]|nr:hypothetical protein MSPP1_002197 [Malassezia sp. CBS 17886]
MSNRDQWLMSSQHNAANVLREPLDQMVGPKDARRGVAYSPSMYSMSPSGPPRHYAPSIAGSTYSQAPPALNGALSAAPSMGPATTNTQKFKTVHTYMGANGMITVSPTYMGGSKARGRGAVVGRVTLQCTEKFRANEVRTKLKAVVAVDVPRVSQATDGNATTFSGLSPSTVSTSSREQVLVQLDNRLRTADATYRVAEGAPASANKSGKFDRNGLYEWDFQFDVPEKGSNKTSTSGFPGVGPYYPSSYVLESDVKGAAKEEWASVKWYVKVTVERPGLFKSNERLLVPFIYLPPPPESVSALLLRRQVLSAQVHAMLRSYAGPIVLPKNLAEAPPKWKTDYFKLTQASLGQNVKRSLVDKMFGANKPKVEKWAISMPGNPLAAFPLRAVVPFVLTLVNSSGMPLVVHPHVYLVQRVHLHARSSAAHTQYICNARVRQSPVSKAGMQQWFGWLQFPSWCSPSFETQLLGLEYYIQVKPLNSPQAQVLATIPLGLRGHGSACAALVVVDAYTDERRGHAAPALTIGRIPHGRVPGLGRRQSIASNAAHMSSPSSASLRQQNTQMGVPAAPFPDVQDAGVAGIGRSQLPGADPSVPGAMPVSPVAAHHGAPGPMQQMPSAPQRAPSRASATLSPSQAHTSTPTGHMAAQAAAADASVGAAAQPAASPHVSSSGGLAPIPDEDQALTTADLLGPGDGDVRDAGPLSEEQEAAWTMDLIQNSMYEETGDAAFELPPSYFEATGINDRDE